MTPQQRHRDEARKMLSTLVPFSEWCPPWEEAVSELALALAEAENRAAWDGWDAGRSASEHEWRGNVPQSEYLREMHAETYGPRPTKETDK